MKNRFFCILCVLFISWLCATRSELFYRYRVACVSLPPVTRAGLFFPISFSISLPLARPGSCPHRLFSSYATTGRSLVFGSVRLVLRIVLLPLLFSSVWEFFCFLQAVVCASVEWLFPLLIWIPSSLILLPPSFLVPVRWQAGVLLS
jgi:hypothetical protein